MGNSSTDSAFRSEVRAIVESEYEGESSAHDIFHLDRVASLAQRICVNDAAGDLRVVLTASYLHDLHRHVERIVGHHVTAMQCDDYALRLMARTSLPPPLYDAVLDAIHYTEYYSFGTLAQRARRLTSCVVRDADNLDAMGAIGIARAFVYGGRIGEPIWDGAQVEPCAQYIPNEKAASVVQHIYDKLIRLVAELEMPTAKEIGALRHAYMEQFVERLKKEWWLGRSDSSLADR